MWHRRKQDRPLVAHGMRRRSVSYDPPTPERLAAEADWRHQRYTYAARRAAIAIVRELADAPDQQLPALEQWAADQHFREPLTREQLIEVVAWARTAEPIEHQRRSDAAKRSRQRRT